MDFENKEKLLNDSIPGVEIWRNMGGTDVVRYNKDDDKIGEMSVDEVLDLIFADLNMDAGSEDPLSYYELFYLPFRRAIERQAEMPKAHKIAIPFMQYIVDKYARDYAAFQRMHKEGLIEPLKSFYQFEPGHMYCYYSMFHDTWQLGVLAHISPIEIFGMVVAMQFTFRSSSYGMMHGGAKKPVRDSSPDTDLLSFFSIGRESRKRQEADKAKELMDSGAVSAAYGIGEVRIPIFVPKGNLEVEKFPVREAVEADVHQYTARGKTYLALVQAMAVADYRGCFIMGKRVMSHGGRIVVDGPAAVEIDPAVAKYRGMSGAPLSIERDWSYDHLAPAEACIFGAQLVFSLQLREWGGVKIDQLTQVRFRENALDAVVMDTHKKELVRALVAHDKNVRFRDLVDNKSSATMILLEGAPGGGKSLTAQSTAETLKRPLYIVDINSLDLDDIEDELRTTLKLARRWNAVVLIDEADALLRHRHKCEPEEARRVATFLRVLEEHEGVIFLTSNHLMDIDRALLSRVSLVIRYPEVSRELRERIWVNLLHTALGEHTINASRLSRWPLNGREIKHAIKMGLILGEQSQQPLSTEAIEAILADAHGALWRLRTHNLAARLRFWR